MKTGRAILTKYFLRYVSRGSPLTVDCGVKKMPLYATAHVLREIKELNLVLT
jgi:hypothetical protein